MGKYSVIYHDFLRKSVKSMCTKMRKSPWYILLYKNNNKE